MASMTWLELQRFIEQRIANKNSIVSVYDIGTGDVLACDFIELNNEEDDSWEPVIAINMEELE